MCQIFTTTSLPRCDHRIVILDGSRSDGQHLQPRRDSHVSLEQLAHEISGAHRRLAESGWRGRCQDGVDSQIAIQTGARCPALWRRSSCNKTIKPGDKAGVNLDPLGTVKTWWIGRLPSRRWQQPAHGTTKNCQQLSLASESRRHSRAAVRQQMKGTPSTSGNSINLHVTAAISVCL